VRAPRWGQWIDSQTSLVYTCRAVLAINRFTDAGGIWGPVVTQSLRWVACVSHAWLGHGASFHRRESYCGATLAPRTVGLAPHYVPSLHSAITG